MDCEMFVINEQICFRTDEGGGGVDAINYQKCKWVSMAYRSCDREANTKTTEDLERAHDSVGRSTPKY